MSDILILYHSEHHGNTKKLVDAAAAAVGADTLALPAETLPDLSAYRAVGFASGVYYSGFHASVLDAVQTYAGAGGECRAFFLYTCGSGSKKCADAPAETLRAAGVKVLGTYFCKGFDTFGPFGLIGGIAKKHPTPDDLSAGADAVRKFLAER
jgi:flavodoxin